MTTYFDRLGVSSDASGEEIAAAYRDLARALHPDAHPNASTAQATRMTQLMAELNEAWHVLKDDDRRAEYLAELDGDLPDAADAPAMRLPRHDECLLCGSFPATDVFFREQRAWVIAASVAEHDLRLCRSCGLGFGRSVQNRTLWLGWWGVLSFFRNLAFVAGNARSLVRVAKLPSPAHRGDDVLVPLLTPIPPGRSSWLRSGLVATVVIFGTLVGLLSTSSSDSRTTSGRTGAVAEWRVGNCVQGSTMLRPVPCSAPHSGRIVDRTSLPSLCPVHADSYVEDGRTIWCIRELG